MCQFLKPTFPFLTVNYRRTGHPIEIENDERRLVGNNTEFPYRALTLTRVSEKLFLRIVGFFKLDKAPLASTSIVKTLFPYPIRKNE